MIGRTAALLLVVISLALIAPGGVQPASAQETDEVLRVTGTLNRGLVVVDRSPGGKIGTTLGRFEYTYTDLSTSGQLNPDLAKSDYHYAKLDLVWDDPEHNGWSLGEVAPSSFAVINPGETKGGYFELSHSIAASELALEVHGALVIVLESPITKQNATISLRFSAVIAPSPVANIEILPSVPTRIKPFERVTIPLRIVNLDDYPATYRVGAEIFDAPGVEGYTSERFMGVGDYYLAPRETRDITISFFTPRDDWWYYDVPVVLQVSVVPAGGGPTWRATEVLTLDGFYISENVMVVAVMFVVIVLLLIFLLVFAKRSYERNYLGRPIPPWQIREEKAFLDRLKREDPRAHYVVRYFLMPEEYRSALLWFYSYKKVSKRQLKADAKSIALREKANEMEAIPLQRFDRAWERIQRRYQRKIERSDARTRKAIAKLQAKLEGNFEKDFEKDHRAWEKAVEKLKTKQLKPYDREKQKWEKANAKALARWEKPFKKKKARYDKAYAKATEKYVKLVKKKDRAAYKAWKGVHEDWGDENRLRKKEGRDFVPEPLPESAIVGPPELPTPVEMPPKPDLPPEPQLPPLRDLPQEPTLSVPGLATSHYAKDVRAAERKGFNARVVLEQELAAKLEKVNVHRYESGEKLNEKRARYEAAADEVDQPSFTDRVLRRTPQDRERRHHKAFLHGLAKTRIKEAQEHEALQVERLRLVSSRQEAELEARVIREKGVAKRAGRVGSTEGRARDQAQVHDLEQQLVQLRRENAKRLATEERASKERLAGRIASIEKEIDNEIRREGLAQKPSASEATTES